MSTSEVRQLAAKVARGILPYNAGCKQAAIRRAMAEFNQEYRRLAGPEKYVEVRDEYLRNLYHGLGLKYSGVDENGEAKAEEDGTAEVEALKTRIRQSLEEQKKQREVAAREQRRLTLKAVHVDKEITDLPPFWFNALIILLLGGAFDGIIFKAAQNRLWPLLLLVGGIALGILLGVVDYVKYRRNVEALRAKAADLRQKAAQQAEKVQQCDQTLLRKQAEFELLCTLLSRSFDLSRFTDMGNTPEAQPAPVPEAAPPPASRPVPRPPQLKRPR